MTSIEEDFYHIIIAGTGSCIFVFSIMLILSFYKPLQVILEFSQAQLLILSWITCILGLFWRVGRALMGLRK